MKHEKGKSYFLMEYTSGTKVVWCKSVARQLGVVPSVVRAKFLEWVTLVQLSGIREVRRRPGFHDELLKGRRSGQRSIRLNRSYRAIYVETAMGEVELIEVTEVMKHDY